MCPLARVLAVLAGLLPAGVGCAGDPGPQLWALASTGEHRLAIERVCSPEHCFSRGRLEWLAIAPGGELLVQHSAPIRELAQSSSLFVRDVSTLELPDGSTGFRLDAVNTYTEEPLVVHVLPGPAGRYRYELQESSALR